MQFDASNIMEDARTKIEDEIERLQLQQDEHQRQQPLPLQGRGHADTRPLTSTGVEGETRKEPKLNTTEQARDVLQALMDLTPTSTAQQGQLKIIGTMGDTTENKFISYINKKTQAGLWLEAARDQSIQVSRCRCHDRRASGSECTDSQADRRVYGGNLPDTRLR